MRLDKGQIEVMDDRMAGVLRQKSPAERIAIANGMWKSAKTILNAAIKASHPDWSDEQVANQLLQRLLHGTD